MEQKDWRTAAQARVEEMGGPTDNVLCPDCLKPMSRRKTARGEFWGCSDFPACRGTRKVGEETKIIAAAGAGYTPILKMPGSPEQEAIWDFLTHGSANVIVNAGPGTGKTWTAVQWCLRAPRTQQITVVAFNKHIAKEANGKLAASKIFNARAKTYHSLGYGILREFYKDLAAPNEDKMRSIFEGLSPMPLYGKAEWRMQLNLAGKLAGFVKNYLIDYRADTFQSEMERLADHHDLDTGKNFAEALALVPTALDKCIEMAQTTIDFDDMIWLPIILGLQSRYAPHLMITDEVQDLGTAEHELMFLAGASRLMAIGDKRQAIYGWRGALTDSISKLADRMGATKIGVREFPLTITRRCPQSHVRLARALFPDCVICNLPERMHGDSNTTHDACENYTPTIQALPDAPEGEILTLQQSKAVEMMKADDLVVCRVNAALIPVAYALIRRKIRPIIKGKDIGKGLRSLIDKLEERAVKRLSVSQRSAYANELAVIWEELGLYMQEETAKLLKLEEKGVKRLAALRDKFDCMMEFISAAKSVEEIRTNLEAIFSDDQKADTVTLGTVHRTKGLEAERVFILAPDLLPHPMARKDWEREQEKNLVWVAVTRAKFSETAPGTLVFCGPIPDIFTPTTIAKVGTVEGPHTVSSDTRVFNNDPEWIRRKAEAEDGCCVSVGGHYFCEADHCDDPACMTHGIRKAEVIWPEENSDDPDIFLKAEERFQETRERKRRMIAEDDATTYEIDEPPF